MIRRLIACFAFVALLALPFAGCVKVDKGDGSNDQAQVQGKSGNTSVEINK